MCMFYEIFERLIYLLFIIRIYTLISILVVEHQFSGPQINLYFNFFIGIYYI